MSETIRTTAVSDRLVGARDDLATISTWGQALPIELRLAAAAADAHLRTRSAMPYPPPTPAAADPQLTVESARALLARARTAITAEIDDADPSHAVGLGFAAREITDALDGTRR